MQSAPKLPLRLLLTPPLLALAPLHLLHLSSALPTRIYSQPQMLALLLALLFSMEVSASYLQACGSSDRATPLVPRPLARTEDSGLPLVGIFKTSFCPLAQRLLGTSYSVGQSSPA